MNLKNRFRLVIISVAAVLVSTTLIVAIGIYYVNVRIQESIYMDGLVANLYELRVLNKEYLLSPSDRVKQQWRAVYAQIQSNLVKQQAIPEDVTNRLNGLNQLFERRASLQEKTSRNDASQKRLRNQLETTIHLESQRIIDWANDVSGQKKNRIVVYAMFAGTVVFSVVLAATLLIIAIMLHTARRILLSVIRLKEGAERIASGNLGYQVEEAGGDEITLLAAAVNRMSSDLMDSYNRLHEQTIQLRASLKEKEVLLREVHHRVKNNMQVISSLLNMQSRNVTDAKTVDIFRASINRIRSMALIHDKLYQTEGLSRIDVLDYIQDLSHSLLRTYSVGPNINLDINVDPLFLDIDTVMPLGILINELVTNSLKHAFPGNRPGRIDISLKNGDGQRLVLTVSDNGIGIPAGLNHTDTQSMGMQLVVTLVEQLDGTMELVRGNGTEFRVIFRAAQEKA